MHEVWDAMDEIFDGKTVEYMDELGEDGQDCSAERWGAFFQAAMEAAAKN